MIRPAITLSVIIALSAPVTAQVADSAAFAPIAQRIALHDDMMPSMCGLSYANPAISQWRQDYSYSTLSAGYHHDADNRPIDVRLGTGSSFWSLQADSYIKHRSSTLWGSASYANGRQRGLCWNESSDAALIYPYFTADSIGGDMHTEVYSFAGGYADHTGRWAWGATLSYNAGLYYRDVDPRPRNTTGRLDIAAGAAVRLGSSDYLAGLSGCFRKYKQSCDIEFVNELSDNSIWHLTGLGTHYERFAGNGYSHYYNGRRWGASANLFPSSRRGAVASVEFDSFSFDHILTGLNKLPLESVTDNSVALQAGWLEPGKSHDLACFLNLKLGSRDGNENLFGDPTGGVYPQIGSLRLYTHRITEAGLNLLWQCHHRSGLLLAVNPRLDWRRSKESYADPRRELILSSLTPALNLKASGCLGARWHASLSADFAYSAALDCSSLLPIDGRIPEGLQQVDIRRYDILSGNSILAGAAFTLSRVLNRRFALGLQASYSHHSYTAGIHSNQADVALMFIF